MKRTDLLFAGSSKEFFNWDQQHYLMRFSDQVHGRGAHSIIAHTGDLRRLFTYYFYILLENHGVKTHLKRPLSRALVDDGLVVRRLNPVRLELIVRNVARGQWVDAHKVPLFEPGIVFQQPVVELCLKIKKELPDGRIIDDPRIGVDLATALHQHAADQELRGKMLESSSEFERLRELALVVNKLLQDCVSNAGWMLEDFKFEVGVDPLAASGERVFIIIDEISPDCARIRDKLGNSLTKDLFRERRPREQIVAGYQRLVDCVRIGVQGHAKDSESRSADL